MNTHDKYELPPRDATANISGSPPIRLYSEAKVRAAIEADRKRRGEPAFYVNARIFDPATGKIKTDVNGALTWSEKPAGNWQVPVYTAPHPAEPVEKPYPIKLYAWGGATRYHDYEMSDGSIQTLKDTEARELGWGRNPAEPVSAEPNFERE